MSEDEKFKGWLRPHSSKLAFLLRLSDGAFVVLAHAIAIGTHPAGLNWMTVHTIASVIAVLIFYLSAESSGLYQAWRGSLFRNEVLRVWATWSITAMILVFVGYLLKIVGDYPRLAALTWYVATPTFLTIGRLLLRLSLQSARLHGRNTRTVAIIGATELGLQIAEEINRSPWLGMRVVGFFEDRSPERVVKIPAHLGKVIGPFQDAITGAKQGDIDLVYIGLPLRAEERTGELIRRFADTTASVYLATDIFAHGLLRARWSSLGHIPVVTVHETPFWGVGGWVKRVEDLVLGTLIMLIIAIPMLMVAIAIKLTSRGPVFFRQRRYGLNGEVIDVLKFRSMHVMENDGEIRQATKNDSRLTPIGGFLRSTSLDELPQFFHVLSGKMSIVGPRPHAVAHNELYRKKIEGYMLRHKVKPGITGWAQVNGWRGETDTLEKMEMRVMHDLEYIRNWGLMWDLQIVAMTILSKKSHRNAH